MFERLTSEKRSHLTDILGHRHFFNGFDLFSIRVHALWSDLASREAISSALSSALQV